MNFIFVSVKGSMYYDIPLVLKDMGHTVTVAEHHEFDPLIPDYTEPLAPVEKELTTNHYNYMITFQYIPILSNLCQKYNLPYISWTYDSPLASVFHESIYNPVNRIFIFDRAFFDRLVQIGIPHVYHMPLAANTTRINAHSFSAIDAEKYNCEISFVGNLYENNAYNHWAKDLSDEILLPVNNYLIQNLCRWDYIRQWPILSPECTYIFSSEYSPFYHALQHFQMPAELYLGTAILSRKLAEMERITALNSLAEDFTVDLYTSSSSHQVDHLRLHPPVFYYTDLGSVYHFSKINLNLTLPSIETGIPLRIFDIMAYGGFVLSNYQLEYESLFQIGKDLIVFHDLAELKEQTRYYLAHESERLQIAANGYRTVNRYYSYEHQLNNILHICEDIPSDR